MTRPSDVTYVPAWTTRRRAARRRGRPRTDRAVPAPTAIRLLAHVLDETRVAGAVRAEAVGQLTLVLDDARVPGGEQRRLLAHPLHEQRLLDVGRDGPGGGGGLRALAERDADGADREHAGDEGHGPEGSGRLVGLPDEGLAGGGGHLVLPPLVRSGSSIGSSERSSVAMPPCSFRAPRPPSGPLPTRRVAASSISASAIGRVPYRADATVRPRSRFWGVMDTDSRLIAELARDLDGAFEALVLTHQDRCYSIALRMLGDPGAAEEAAQDALVRAYRALAGYDAGADPRPAAPGVAGDDRAQPVPDPPGPTAGGRARRRCRSTSPDSTLARAGRHRRVDLAERGRRPRAPSASDGRPPGDAPARLPGRRRPPPRRRPVLPRARHRPRPTRGHRQGPGPPRPGAVAHGARGRPSGSSARR